MTSEPIDYTAELDRLAGTLRVTATDSEMLRGAARLIETLSIRLGLIHTGLGTIAYMLGEDVEGVDRSVDRIDMICKRIKLLEDRRQASAPHGQPGERLEFYEVPPSSDEWFRGRNHR